MLCDNCLNKRICKYYSLFIDAPMEIKIESCETYNAKYKNSSDNTVQDTEQFVFKTPIDYSQFDKTEENIALLEYEEETELEERITVDLSQDHSDKVVSITDLLLGEDK